MLGEHHSFASASLFVTLFLASSLNSPVLGAPGPAPPSQDFVLDFGGPQIALAPLNTALDLRAEFTMEAWVFRKGMAGADVILGRPHVPRGADPFLDFAIGIDSAGHATFIQSTGQPGSFSSITSTASLPLRTWTHLAGTLGSGTMKLYVNGSVAGTTLSSGPPGPGTVPFSIGGGLQSKDQICCSAAVALRQVRLWSRALTAVELTANASVSLLGTEAGLIAYWPLDDGTGQKARDLGPKRLDLQLGIDAALDHFDPRWVHTAVLDGGPFFVLDDPVYAGGIPGSAVPSLHPAAGVIDFDHDGAPDVVLARWIDISTPAPLLALRNDGSGRFKDATTEVFVPTVPMVLGPVEPLATDLNGDGRQDLFWGSVGMDLPPYPGAQSLLFLQTPSGQLQDVTNTNLPQQMTFDDGGAAPGDFNKDGALDFYFADLGHAALYWNDGTGRFTADRSCLPPQWSNGMGLFDGAVALDAQQDGNLDLALGAVQHSNTPRDALLANDGYGRFSFGRSDAMPPRQTGPDGITNKMVTADFNGDGWPDVVEIQANENFSGSRVVLLLNKRDGTFWDATERLPRPRNPDEYPGRPQIADFNGDGIPDLLVGASSLFLNMGGAYFVDASEVLPTDFLWQPSWALTADFDGDGRIDILAYTDQWFRLLRSVKPFAVSAGPELLLPVVLDVAGLGGSHYTTELTLASKATTPVEVRLLYSASLGSGTGYVPVTLGPGETRVISDAISFLRSEGLPIPTQGGLVGTLSATFVGASSSRDVFIGGRTFTTGVGGTFGLFYPAATTGVTTATIVGLQESSTQRSNLALVNAGGTPITLRVRLFGAMGEDLGTLPDQSLPPHGWTQINRPLLGKAGSGRAEVTRVSGTSDFTTYAVLNDAVTSDGSFIPPLAGSDSGPADRLVPIVLDVHGLGGSHYTSELTLANLTNYSLPLVLVYTASLGGGSGQASLTLAPGEQRIVPDAIRYFRSQGMAIPADGSNVGGSVLVLPPSGTSASAFGVGARTFTPTPSGEGTFGLYYPGAALAESATSTAFVNGLQQNDAQRSNLAVVNRGDASDPITLKVTYFNSAGAALGTPATVVLAPGGWAQFGQPLQDLGATSGFARIDKVAGSSRFVAYGVLNDSGTSDGGYIPMSW